MPNNSTHVKCYLENEMLSTRYFTGKISTAIFSKSTDLTCQSKYKPQIRYIVHNAECSKCLFRNNTHLYISQHTTIHVSPVIIQHINYTTTLTVAFKPKLCFQISAVRTNSKLPKSRVFQRQPQ